MREHESTTTIELTIKKKWNSNQLINHNNYSTNINHNKILKCGWADHYTDFRNCFPNVPILLIPKYIFLLHRLILFNESQLAWLRNFAPSTPMLFPPKYIFVLHRSISVNKGQLAWLRNFAPSAHMLLSPKYLFYYLDGFQITKAK